MTNNDILRRIRFIFNLSDSRMMAIFALADHKVTREEVSNLLKKEDDPTYQKCYDTMLATFLNGFISDKRGKKEGPLPVPEKRLNNNIILRKMKIALNLKDEDMLKILEQADFRLSKHEVSAFFRKPDHKHYRPCKDQVLRCLLKGLQITHRPDVPLKTEFKWK